MRKAVAAIRRRNTLSAVPLAIQEPAGQANNQTCRRLQCFFVLTKGISVIGPRPMILAEHEQIETRSRYGVNDIRPGLTGWAQINGRDAGSGSRGGSDSSTSIDEATVDADGSATSGSAAAAGAGAASNPGGDAADPADAASESGSEQVFQLDSLTEQEQGASFPWFWATLGIVVVAACAAACLWLWRKRNR